MMDVRDGAGDRAECMGEVCTGVTLRPELQYAEQNEWVTDRYRSREASACVD